MPPGPMEDQTPHGAREDQTPHGAVGDQTPHGATEDVSAPFSRYFMVIVVDDDDRLLPTGKAPGGRAGAADPPLPPESGVLSRGSCARTGNDKEIEWGYSDWLPGTEQSRGGAEPSVTSPLARRGN